MRYSFFQLFIVSYIVIHAYLFKATETQGKPFGAYELFFLIISEVIIILSSK